MKLREYSNNVKHYLRIYKRVFLGGLSRSYIYKQDIFIRFVRSLCIIAFQIILLNTIFAGGDMFVGWSKSEAYLVIGMWNLLNSVGWSFFGINLVYLEHKVLEGSFDYVLLKPVLPSWFASFCDFFVYDLVSVVSGLIIVFYYFIVEWSSLSLFNVLFGVLGIVIAIFIWYSIYLLFSSFTISKPRNGFMRIAKELLGITRYPIDIFGESFKVVFYTVVPLAFLTSVPSNIIIGRFGYEYLLYGLLIGGILYVLANYLWKLNIRKYTSASS